MKASLLFSPSAGNRVILPASVVAREPTRQHQGMHVLAFEGVDGMLTDVRVCGA